jgi:tol-pal system protein YbgF
MRGRLVLSGLALLGLFSLPAWAGVFDDDGARKQVAELKAQTQQQLDIQSQAQIDLSTEIAGLKEEIARLRGQVETLNYQLDTAQKRQQDYYVDLDGRLRKLESSAAPAVSAGDPAAAAMQASPPPVKADPAVEGKTYEQAMSLFKAGKYKEAGQGFEAFVAAYPNGDLTANAAYWLGNSWYAQGNCTKAIEVQNQVFNHWPQSPWAPEALLAIANCQKEAGNTGASRKTLETLVSRYPDAPAATTALKRLGRK